MAPQDARERCARQRLVIEPAEYHKALKVYAQVHDLVSEAIDEGLLNKAWNGSKNSNGYGLLRLGPERYCKLVRLLGDVGAMWKEHKEQRS